MIPNPFDHLSSDCEESGRRPRQKWRLLHHSTTATLLLLFAAIQPASFAHARLTVLPTTATTPEGEDDDGRAKITTSTTIVTDDPPFPVTFLVDLTVHKDQQGQPFEEVVDSLISVTQREDGAYAYNFFNRPNNTDTRILASFADGTAAMTYLQANMVLFNRLKSLTDQTRFEVVGDPGRAAEKLTNLGAAMYGGMWKGYNRLAGPTPSGGGTTSTTVAPSTSSSSSTLELDDPTMGADTSRRSRNLLRNGQASKVDMYGDDIDITSRVTLLIDLKVHDGQKDAFGRAVDGLLQATKNETSSIKPLQYCFFLSEDGTQARIVETHVNVTSAKNHYEAQHKSWLHGLENVTDQTGFGVLAPSSAADATKVYGNALPSNAQVYGHWKGFDKMIIPK